MAEVENVSESVGGAVVVPLGERVEDTVVVDEGCAEEDIGVGTSQPFQLLECGILREKPDGTLTVEAVEQLC